jgi:hypothetical protein
VVLDAICLLTPFFIIVYSLPDGATFVVRDLPDGVWLACCARLVAFDVIPAQEDTITRDNFARLKDGDVTHNDVLLNDFEVSKVRGRCETYLDVNCTLYAVTYDFDGSFVFLVIKDLELPFLLPIVDGTNDDLTMPSAAGMWDDDRLMLTTMNIATIIAIPSTQSTGGCPGVRPGPKSCNRPSARAMIAAIERRI